MADKSVITNLEARVKQLIDDHRRLSELCAELTATAGDAPRGETHAGRACPGAGRRAGAHAATEGLAGEQEPGKSAGARQPSYAGGGQVHRAAGAAAGSAGGPIRQPRKRRETENETKEERNGKTVDNPQNSGKKLSAQYRTRKKEEVYRLAEREVNNYLAQIKQREHQDWNDQDYLSITALQFASCERRNAPEPRGGQRRSPAAGKNRHGNRYVSQRPERVTPEGGTHRRKTFFLHTRIYPHRFLKALRN